jgi:hypothetical protein
MWDPCTLAENTAESYLSEKPAFHSVPKQWLKRYIFSFHPLVKTTAHAQWNLMQAKHAQ